eukprot:TRINITY_DN14068_c0_g1_i1.p2 TRINITY_DN14068_c0_g1~~TRINITY_DN14068_c0_g1_i1.p2  ORF type:complete len:318 (+),score=110.88 TRINITY_DN14068_c0_g1_i1:147-1100(+)
MAPKRAASRSPQPAGPGKRGSTGGGRDKKNVKAERAAVEEQFRRLKDELQAEEERQRMEVGIAQQLERKECKLAKKRQTNQLLVDNYAEIGRLRRELTDLQKTTTVQIIKLEDELSRTEMSRKVVQQEVATLKAEVTQLRSDDGGKQMIAQLNAQIRQVQLDTAQKETEHEAAMEALRRKLAKQISENRLMRIAQKEAETEWGSRIRKLENSLTDALEELISNAEERGAPAVSNFNRAVDTARDEYLAALKASRDGVLGITDTLVDIKSMHTNLPPYLRAVLQQLSREELLMIIDVLSFEDAVLQYLSAKFPKETAS